MELFVDLADLIDVAAEIAKKKDELAKLEGRIASQRKKLANENFIQRAPAAVVQKERDALEEARLQQANLSLILEALLSASAKRGENREGAE